MNKDFLRSMGIAILCFVLLPMAIGIEGEENVRDDKEGSREKNTIAVSFELTSPSVESITGYTQEAVLRVEENSVPEEKSISIVTWSGSYECLEESHCVWYMHTPPVDSRVRFPKCSKKQAGHSNDGHGSSNFKNRVYQLTDGTIVSYLASQGSPLFIHQVNPDGTEIKAQHEGHGKWVAGRKRYTRLYVEGKKFFKLVPVNMPVSSLDGDVPDFSMVHSIEESLDIKSGLEVVCSSKSVGCGVTTIYSDHELTSRFSPEMPPEREVPYGSVRWLSDGTLVHYHAKVNSTREITQRCPGGKIIHAILEKSANKWRDKKYGRRWYRMQQDPVTRFYKLVKS